MNKKEELLSKIEASQNIAGTPLFPGANPLEIERLVVTSQKRLGTTPPKDYLGFLEIHDGLTVEGIFIYSTSLEIENPEDKGLSFIEMNIAHRDLQWKSDYIFLGDSDLDVYTLNTKSSKYEVRDKQALDNLFEEFDNFEDLLTHILQEIASRI